MSELNELKNKHVIKTTFTEDKISFECHGETISYAAYGDCCSSSFIESLDNEEDFRASPIGDYKHSQRIENSMIEVDGE